MTNRVCKNCKRTLPLNTDYFYKCKDNYQIRCKECARAKQSKWRADNPDKYERMLASTRGDTYLHFLRNIKRYGLDEPTFRGMLDSQRGCCAICQSSLVNPEWSQNDMHIDHCHDTGSIRGLLCTKCNRGIGLLGEDVNTLSRATFYVLNGGY